MKKFLVVLGAISAVAVGGCGGGGNGDGNGGVGGGTVASFTTGDFTQVTLSASTIGAGGGTITSADLPGFSIVIPAGATDEDISFTVSYSDITNESGLPTGAASSSKAVRIEAGGSDDWNNERMFNLPLKVTLPYNEPADGENSVRFYVYNADGSLEPAGLESVDRTGNTITFYTRTFANAAEGSKFSAMSLDTSVKGLKAVSAAFSIYVAIGLGTTIDAWLDDGTTVNTGFAPSSNGWYIPNYGSYYKASRGGSCFGFVAAAKYYYRQGYSPALYTNYRDAGSTTTWLDDAVAIEFTSRVHNGLADIWDRFVSGEVNEQEPSSQEVAYSYMGGLYVTGFPVMLYIQQVMEEADGTKRYTGAHAISVHRADITAGGAVTFYVYDPNFPADDSRRITYTDGTGFDQYRSGTDAASSRFQYNFFKHIGYNVGLSDAVLDRIKEAADKGFADSSIFPTVTIDEVKGYDGGVEMELASEGTTATTGEHAYVTNYAAVQIKGTILGGLAQDACCVVDNASVFINNQRYSVPVNNQAGGGDGTFTAIVPVAQGDNELVIIAAKRNSFSHWAAFKRDAVKSNASAAAMTVTLNWGQDKSDVDLYVKEPSLGGKTGDTVYYQNRKGTSETNPYLDVDNTTGYGPEHYYAKSGMMTEYTDGSSADNLYGDYTVKTHYYADHKCDALTGDEYTQCLAEPPQTMTWTVGWRYLAYCPDPCADHENDGFWVEGSQSGSLATANSDNCCDINNSGADWSSAWTVSYPQPDPADWVVPSSTTVMLP